VDSDSEYFLIPYIARNWSRGEDRAVTVLFYGRGGTNTDYRGGSATFDPDGPGPAPITSLPGSFGAGNAGVDLTQGFFELALSWKLGEVALGFAPVIAVQAFEATGVSSFAGFTKTFAASCGTRRFRSDREPGISLMYAPEKRVSGPNAFDPTQQIELQMDQFEVEVSWSW
jgi:long-chain fatty acid transport protein